MATSVFIITMAPIRMPYDDAAKNFAIEIASKIQNKSFLLIATKKLGIQQKNNMRFIHTPFSMERASSMPIYQKIFLFHSILSNIKKVDIFHFITTPERISSSILRRLFRAYKKKSIQTVTSIHTLEIKNKNRDMKKLFFADRIITHSDYAKKQLIKKGILNVERIYPGVNAERFNPSKVKGKKRNFPCIVYAGRYSVLDKSFGIEKFCLMAKEVLSEIKNARFILACRIRSREDKILETKIKDLVEEYGIKDNIETLDTVENMPLLFKNCDIGIFPAVRPTSGILEIPLALLELMAMEKPVVFGNIMPLNEIMKSEIGIMINPDESYSNVIIGLLKNKSMQNRMGKNGRKTVMKFFNSDRIVMEYNKIYNALGEQ